MLLVATASKTVRNKNLLMILLCALFTGWFAYDGWIAWPTKNDAIVAKLVTKVEPEKERDPAYFALLKKWPGWEKATPQERGTMYEQVKSHDPDESWHTETDLFWQKVITFALAGATLAALGWHVHCQRRQVQADDTGLTIDGQSIPWGNITKIDNTRWAKMRIVDLEYRDAQGSTQTAKLDDYLLDNLPPILNEVANRANQAEFVPPTSPG